MDPLSAVGLISSIAQLADASFKIVKLLDTIKEGGRDRRRLCDEITLLWMTLRNLETQFAPLSAEQDGAWIAPIDSLAEPNGVFEQLTSALDDVWKTLTTSDTRKGKVLQTLRWPLDQKYVERIVSQIEHLKTSIIMVEGQASIALAQEMRDDVSSVKKTVDDSRFQNIVDWLSPCNFIQKQENITATPGTGGWFFTSEEFRSWESGDDRWLWCYGIPGAGKTFLASSTVNELRRLHKVDNTLVLVAFCSFDSMESQSIENLVASLLKQVIQMRMTLPPNLERLYEKHKPRDTKPKLEEICDILNGTFEGSQRTYVVLDALDELAEDTKRTTLLDTLYNLKNKPKIMVTSRKIENIANRFGYPLNGIYCDGCEKRNLEVYHHCEDCVDFDYCQECREQKESTGHSFVRRYSSIRMRISAQPEDMESYIKRRIEVEEDLQQMVERRPKLLTRILDTIVETAQDMFLLARFHMDALADCLTVGEVIDALEHLPQGINHTYDQALARIAKLSPNRQRAVKRLLLWTSYAERPLTTKELEHATTITRGARQILTGHLLSARTLTSLSAGLVIIDENDNVRLTHKTAEDYFKEKRSALFPAGDVELAECCLSYLHLEAFEAGPCNGPDESKAFDTRWKVYPLLGYAAVQWGNHARRSNSELVTHQVLMFLRNQRLVEASVQAMWYTDTVSENSWDVSDGVGAIHLASYFGLNEIVIALLAEGADPNDLDSRGTTALAYACFKEHMEVVETLLSAGALASIIDDRGSTALHRAVEMRNQALVKRLISEEDVAINAFYSSWSNYTALLIACWYGDAGLVKILLVRPDIDVNLASPTARWNPLMLSAADGEDDCVKILLDHPNIDKDCRDETEHTAIHHAALNGRIGALDLLLKSGANPNLEDDQGGRPLQRAIDYNEYEVVEMLLKHGVEYDFKDFLGRNIFHAAAINGRFSILRLLLETCTDMDVNAQGDGGETPLHDAASRGFLETTKVLVEFGARTDILNKGGRTPVRAAKDAEMTDILEVLREAREREKALDEKHGAHLVRKADTFAVKTEQPLTMLVESADIETLRSRISRTSVDELNAYSPDWKHTALHIACDSGRPEVATLLLEAGAFVDPMDAFNRSPLTIACQKGDPDLVRVLVQYGADVNMTKFSSMALWDTALRNGGTKAAVFLLAQPQTVIDRASDRLGSALGWAAVWGDLAACKRLVEAGAPVRQKNADGLTPAQIAKGWEHEEVERFLFETATKQREFSSPKLPTISTDTKEKQVEDDGIPRPPRRSPTSKKELLELAKPDQAQTAYSHSVSSITMTDKDQTQGLSSSTTLAIVFGLLAVFLSIIAMTSPTNFVR